MYSLCKDLHVFVHADIGSQVQTCIEVCACACRCCEAATDSLCGQGLCCLSEKSCYHV